ncbi:hypothetical protein [Acidovorax cavernicola]|uniref:hypothetical protein n=1 Tax=Acidovorax cavernicola TaxID=1675792 RepID=UPI0011C38068|nr:hypothetical protein [Acidovorax cavernicola]
MNKSSFLIILAFLCANFPISHARNTTPQISISNESKITIKTENGTHTYHLNQKISQAKANCRKNNVLVWGSPKKTSNEAPQAAYLSLIEIRKKKVIYSGILGGGVREVRYPRSGDWALIHTNLSFFINLKTGARKYASESYDPESFSEETCDGMPVINAK